LTFEQFTELAALTREGLWRVERRPQEATAERVADGVWWLDLPLPYPPGTVNAYLLEADAGWLLVDCGCGLAPGWDALNHALALAGVEPRSLVTLVGTHSHLDHVGLAHEVVARTGAQFLLAGDPEPVIDAIRNPSTPEERRRELARLAGIPADEIPRAIVHPGSETLTRIEPARGLDPDEVFETRSGAWRTVPAPGHSPNMVMLFNERTRWLITADLVYVGRSPYLEYAFSPDPYADALASIHRAQALEPSLILPGHGLPARDVPEQLAAAEGSLLRLAERIRAAVASEPSTAFDVLLRVLRPGHTTQVRQAAMAGLLSTLEHLVSLGEVVETARADGVRLFLSARASGR
jgi:glyoxylase-like metal-dependent hydrolase (beta-lactamase superfamily II)